jgi:hypothetical protein
MRPESQIRRSLTQTALRRLLQVLDADADRAADRYRDLHEGLCALFHFWGASETAELADRTLDRVAMKLDEGVVVAPDAIGRYTRGVARMILHESHRTLEKEHRTLAEFDRTNMPDERRGRVLDALEHCLGTLAAHERTLVLDYYAAEGSDATHVRQRLAVRIGVSWTALRIRVLRLRQRLEVCVSEAMKH